MALWTRGAFRPQDSWVKGLIAEYVDGRVSDLRGPDAVSAGQRSLITTAAIAHAVVALIFRASKDAGLFVKDEHGGLALTRAMAEVPKFLARIQASEVALGVGARQPANQDAYALMKRSIPVEVKRVESQS
jgi:hypothetical protein